MSALLGTIAAIPTKAQIEFFARWNEAARREDRAADLAKSMAQRIEEAAGLSRVVDELRGSRGRGQDVQRG